MHNIGSQHDTWAAVTGIHTCKSFKISQSYGEAFSFMICATVTNTIACQLYENSIIHAHHSTFHSPR